MCIVAIVLLIISCTGCDPHGNEPDLLYEPVILTYDTDVILSYRWVKETTSEDPEYMAFDAYQGYTDTDFTLVVYGDEELQEQSMGVILLEPEVSAVCMIGEFTYVLKISSTESGVITLSLKNKEEGIAMYFAPILHHHHN